MLHNTYFMQHKVWGLLTLLRRVSYNVVIFVSAKKSGIPLFAWSHFAGLNQLNYNSFLRSKTHLKSKSPKKSLICWSRLLAETQPISNATMHMVFAANICDDNKEIPVFKVSTRNWRFDIKIFKCSPFIPLVMSFINFYYIILKWILYHF